MRVKQIDFSNGKILENIFLAATPMLVAQVLSLMYNIIDRIYIGKIAGEGTLALSGIGLCFPIISLITAFTNLYGLGGAPLCSIERGKGNLKEAENIMKTSFYLLIITGIIITILGIIFCTPLLYLFGASDVTLKYAKPYMIIYLLGTIFSMVALGMNPFINAQGFANIGMLTIFIGALANIILDPIFIFIFDLGIKGAAIATVISQFFSVIFVIKFLIGKKTELKLNLKERFYFKKARVLNIIGLGSASFVMQCTNSLVQIASNNMLSTFGGDLYISVMTIINSIRQIVDTPVLAITDGTSPILSYNYGAKKYKNVKKAIFIMASLSLLYTLIMWRIILLFPKFLIGIFNKDEILLEASVSSLHIYFFAFIFQALMYSGQAVFKALNKKKQAICFSLLRKVVIVIPLTYFLPYINNFGVKGVFMAEPVSNFLGGSICFIGMLLMVLPELKKEKVK
ncbi:MATE family efflux transporter [uncultured Fusobacterium sp.]|uniref:MATE family efflux transporter n=1 Tax=uncultured Fusobacterium sp. TaxID=159267 RepID=UPI0025DF5069|nr:MATE family efflux transporter [uncultured Fusobacterium sp.]